MTMPNVSPDEIREIMETSLTDSAIDAYIGAARLIADNYLGSSGMSTALLLEIVRWLSCHLIASSRERQIKSDATGQAKVEYDSKVGLGLNSTTFGAQVLLLDSSGLLAASSKRAVSIYAVPSFTEETE